MRMILLTFLCCMLLVPAAAQDSPLVSAEWLQQHINDPDLVILHVDFNRRGYTAGHIPGSQFVWWDWIVPSTPDFSSELPTQAEAQKLLRSFGVNNTSRIVVVFSGSRITSGTRPLWTLFYFGLGDRSFMLDGGLNAWREAGGKLVTEMSTPAQGTVTLTTNTRVYADASFIKAHMNDPKVTIVDARSKVYFDGRPTGQPKAGHIRGAVSIPYSEVIDSLSHFRSLSELRSLFKDAGVKEGSTVVTYCHVGQQATATLLAAKLLGYNVMMYDGSFEDWSYQDDSFPVEIPGSEND